MIKKTIWQIFAQRCHELWFVYLLFLIALAVALILIAIFGR